MNDIGICPKCQRRISILEQHCPYCGAEISLIIRGGEIQECPECHGAATLGTMVGVGKQQCPTCGYIGKVRIYEITDRRTGVSKRVIRSVNEGWDGQPVREPL